MAGYIGTQAVSVNTTSATISDDLSVGDDLTVTDDATIGGTALVTGVLTTTAATVFNGGFAANASSTITTADNLVGFTLVSTDADANTGPRLHLERNSASPADGDIGGVLGFFADNDAGEMSPFARIRLHLDDVSNGSEDGNLKFFVLTAGTEVSRMGLASTETVFNEDSVDVDFRVESNGNENMLFVDGGDNNVGIGRAPATSDGGAGSLQIEGNDGLAMRRNGQTNSFLMRPRAGSVDGMRFTQGGTGDVMTIDTDGNLLVNCTTPRSQNTAVSGGVLLQVKGDIVPDIDAGNTGHSDLGDPSFRFEDTFCRDAATTGSDQNDKQNIAVLSSTEMAVAARISQNFKLFKWKDSVAAKGNDARTHAGTMAQDIKAAFIAEDLDASNYAMFMSNSWWEHDVEVDAVESNEDEGIIAADAYTRTDLYHVESEAPEGSTAVTRLGVRYSEVMSFLAAYNEQRFAAIETRLTALEG